MAISFCFSASQRKTKKRSNLCDLCVSAVKHLTAQVATFERYHSTTLISFDTGYRSDLYLNRKIIGESEEKIEMLITHRFPMSEVQKAWELQITRQCGKVILDPWA